VWEREDVSKMVGSCVFFGERPVTEI